MKVTLSSSASCLASSVATHLSSRSHLFPTAISHDTFTWKLAKTGVIKLKVTLLHDLIYTSLGELVNDIYFYFKNLLSFFSNLKQMSIDRLSHILCLWNLKFQPSAGPDKLYLYKICITKHPPTQSALYNVPQQPLYWGKTTEMPFNTAYSWKQLDVLACDTESIHMSFLIPPISHTGISRNRWRKPVSLTMCHSFHTCNNGNWKQNIWQDN